MCTIHTQNRANLLAKLVHAVAVALLAVAAEAVEILTHLRSRETHFFGKLLGGNTRHPALVQVPQKAVVARQTPNDRHGNIRFLLHIITSFDKILAHHKDLCKCFL